MAGRVLRRAAALGLAAAAAGSLHALARWEPPVPLASFNPAVRSVLLDSAQGLHAALLRTHPFSGALIREVRARAERDLAFYDAEGGEGERDPAVAVDLRLLLAFLATRDGRADEALRLYTEAARDSPFDRRPLILAFYICHMSRRREEAAQWIAAYRRLVPHVKHTKFPGYESPETKDLIHELVIASLLGGVFDASFPEDRCFVMDRACGVVDSGLVMALQDKARSMAERLQLLALRVCLQAKVRALLRGEKALIARIREEEEEDGGAR